MKKILSILIVGLTLSSYSQALSELDYWNYHYLISQAENSFFVEENVDSCLYYYNLAFDNFEYNFPNDLINAAQITYYTKQKNFTFYPVRQYEYYLHKAVKYGLRSKHLQRIPMWENTTVLDDFLKYEKTDEWKLLHSQYLESINTEFLGWIYELCLNEIKDRRNCTNDSIYYCHLQQMTDSLLFKTKASGFPGSKNIGIDDDELYDEMGLDYLDFKRLVTSDSLLCIISGGVNITVLPTGDTIIIDLGQPSKNCYDMDVSRLSQGLVEVFLWHHPCAFEYIREIALKEIADGNLHPREFALLHDAIAMNQNNIETDYCSFENDGEYFLIGISDQSEIFGGDIPIEQTNALRKKYHLCSLEADRQKKRYEKEFGLKIRWGVHKYL